MALPAGRRLRATGGTRGGDRADGGAHPIPSPRAFVTRHTGRFGSDTVAYTATAGETFLRDDKGEPKAAIYSFA
jgi:glutamate synthase domain-containing protein 3